MNEEVFNGMSKEEIEQVNKSLEEIYNKNKFGLVYKDAIKENIKGQVNIENVNYLNHDGIKISANIYYPANYNENKSYVGIAVAHPNGGVKEQVSGLFAEKLAENGYITIAFDSAYQGASGGIPRQTDRPSNRVEDIRCAIDYLQNIKSIKHIGALGICGGGGYTIETSKTDKRIEAVATVSMFNTGRVRRNGMSDNDIKGIEKRLIQGSNARSEYVKEGIVEYIGNHQYKRQNLTKEELENIPAGLYRDGVEYYGQTHFHPLSQSVYTAMSLLDLMKFDVENQAELITQPLLMITGDISDTRYMTEGVFNKCTGTTDKELFLVPNANHIETYWKEEFVKLEVEKLISFFDNKLKGKIDNE